MSIRLSDLKRNQRTIPVAYMGETVNVTYRPSEITPMLVQSLDDPNGRVPLATVLSKVLLSWDVVDDEGQPIPITLEFLASFGYGLQRRIWSEISADTIVGKPPSATSDAG